MVTSNDSPVFIIYAILYSLLFLISLLGNLTILYAVKRTKQLQLSINYYICNLAVADILYTSLIYSYIISQAVDIDYRFSVVTCNITQGGIILGGKVYMMTLVMINISRYYAVAKPLKVKFLFIYQRCGYVLCIIWMIGGVVALLPILGWSTHTSISKTCQFENETKHYLIFLFGIDILSCCTITLFYISIHKVVNNRVTPSQIVIASSSTNAMVTVENTESNTDTVISQTKIKAKKPEKISLMLLIIVVAYAVSWAPISIMIPFENFSYVRKNIDKATLALMFTCLNGLVNPCIYYLMSSNYRNAFKDIFRLLFNR